MWEPRRLTTLWASTACCRESFTFRTSSTPPIAAVSNREFVASDDRMTDELEMIWKEAAGPSRSSIPESVRLDQWKTSCSYQGSLRAPPEWGSRTSVRCILFSKISPLLRAFTFGKVQVPLLPKALCLIPSYWPMDRIWTVPSVSVCWNVTPDLWKHFVPFP
jgi:hypothetical protein